MSAADPKNDAIKALHRDFITKLFETDLGVSVKDVTTLLRCNNNFIHFVTLASSVDSDVVVSTKPGTSAISLDTNKAVFRVGNPAAMFNHAVKVENTVAMMHLARQALSDLGIVLKVYAWSGTGEPSGHGWILEEYMPGIEVESKFHSELAQEDQHHVLSQMATVLKKVQDFDLPPKASGFGGLRFEADNEVVNGPFVVEPYDGPYSDMKSMYKGMLKAQLAEADRSRVAEGYREDGLRERLDAFAERGLETVLSQSLPETVKPNLIIGDVAIANLLFDPVTYKATGLVDYDCSHVGHPLHEYFFSTFSVNYFVISAKPEIAAALFHQYPSPLPESEPITKIEPGDHAPPQWELMAFFEQELDRIGAGRPSNIPGAEEITHVYEFMAEVCPFHFVMERWIEKQDEGKLKACKAEQIGIIDRALTKWGF
ncbi:hypothetical protein E4T39_06729 [Aureobasidium subglaciale]|nr:hypothetical protein E4T39_06729 [Aureobasidium subglaciale]